MEELKNSSFFIMQIRIVHFSDSHEPASFEHWKAFTDKRLIGLINSNLIRKNNYDQKRLSAAIRYILQNPPELAIFTGDATSCGQPGEFGRALHAFQPLLQSRIPFLYVPGNHDAYVRDVRCRSALEQFTLEMSRGEHPLHSYPFCADFPWFKVAAIHCARPFNPVLSCGYMTPETVCFLEEAAKQKNDKPLICAGHFPLIIHNSLLNFRRRLYGASKVTGLLQSHTIDLSLCGHIHDPLEQLDNTGRGEIIAGSITKKGILAEIIYETVNQEFILKRINI